MALPLDDTISLDQAGHLADHQTIAQVLNSAFTFVSVSSPGVSEVLAFVPAAVVHYRLPLDSASCAITFSGAVDLQPSVLVLEVRQDATGSRLLTWPAAVKWPNGLAPTLSTVANARDRLEFTTRDGGATVDGVMVGAGFA